MPDSQGGTVIWISGEVAHTQSVIQFKNTPCRPSQSLRREIPMFCHLRITVATVVKCVYDFKLGKMTVGGHGMLKRREIVETQEKQIALHECSFLK